MLERCVSILIHKPPAHLSQASETRSKELGASVVAVDYGDIEAMVEALEQDKIDTVISTLGPEAGQEPEMNLIEAANKSSSTKRYIPKFVWYSKHTRISAIAP